MMIKLTIKSYNITKIFIQFYFLNSYLLSYGVNICIVQIFKKISQNIIVVKLVILLSSYSFFLFTFTIITFILLFFDINQKEKLSINIHPDE